MQTFRYRGMDVPVLQPHSPARSAYSDRIVTPGSYQQFSRPALKGRKAVWTALLEEACARAGRGAVISDDKIDALKMAARPLIQQSKIEDIDMQSIPYKSILLMGALKHAAGYAVSIPDLTRLVVPVILEAGKSGRIDFVGGPITAFGKDHISASWDALETATILLAFESAAARAGTGKPEIMHMSTVYVPDHINMRINRGRWKAVQDAWRLHHREEQQARALALSSLSRSPGSIMTKAVGEWWISEGTLDEIDTSMKLGITVASYGSSHPTLRDVAFCSRYPHSHGKKPQQALY